MSSTRSSLPTVATFLFGSGACALIYQVAWFRELRLIFGSSTSASAAVLAVFMAGLGIGGVRLGKRADAAPNPLALYAKLEIGVALTAAATPFLIMGADRLYIATGGSAALGNGGATVVRLVLSVLVLSPSTFLMGGTLPAAARAVEQATDTQRTRVATLYGVNTFGAVVGTLLANFAFLEIFGSRMTLWLAALLNLLVGMLARGAARRAKLVEDEEPATETAEPGDAKPAVAEQFPWFPPAAAALAGGAFMLLELVWYRMLAPLLGGSSYTFGLILAIALIGIGIGGALYARHKGTLLEASLRGLAITFALEAIFVLLPLALGDRLAILTLLLRPVCMLGFAPAMGVWSLIAAIVVLPAAIVSGAQFPLIIALYGKGKKGVGRDVGNAYFANTAGAITGCIGGGFGLIPLLGAVSSWRLAGATVLVGAIVTLALDARRHGLRVSRMALPTFVVLVSSLFVTAKGPSPTWRHTGIGNGRADGRLDPPSPERVADFENETRRSIRWEQDGVESSVALGSTSGFAFIVNGKADGHAIGDGPTQVMSGLLPAMIHPNPRSSMVIGLGTGSSAGWLGKIPSMEKVDVVELEPAILRVARDCVPVNEGVLENPKVHIQLADAREVLRTRTGRYDLIFSEPSNPYRAGISSMFTADFYRAVEQRLAEGGIFVQWFQAYDTDAWGVATVLRTLREVFPNVTVWETIPEDMLLLAQRERTPVDMDRIRARLKQEPYATGTRSVWRTETPEGVVAHHIASNDLTSLFLDNGLGSVNTDDQNLLEFVLARRAGSRAKVDAAMASISRRYGFDRRDVTGPVDWKLVEEERAGFREWQDGPPEPVFPGRPAPAMQRVFATYHLDDPATTLRVWKAMNRTPTTLAEASVVADSAGRAGDGDDERLLALAPRPSERDFAVGHWAARHNDLPRAAESLARAFVALRTDPWARREIIENALRLAVAVGRAQPSLARGLAVSLAEPFAAEGERRTRLVSLAMIGDVLPDSRFCLMAHEALTPPPLFVPSDMVDYRARCFARTNHAGREEAEELVAKRRLRARPFAVPIPRPAPEPPQTAPPPPIPPPSASAARDAATAADAGPADATRD